MSGGFYKSVMLDDELFQEIEKILKVKLSDENKEALHGTCHGYLTPMRALVKEKEEATDEEREAARVMTTPKRVKDQLQTIQKYCTLLRCAIQNADDITSDLLFSCLVSSHPKTIKGISKIKTMAARKIREDLNRKLVNELENNYEHLPQDLGFMEEAAAIALKNTGQHNGRKSDYRLNLLLSRLSAFYIDVTGRKAKITFNNHPNCYEGIFFNFCETFLTLIGREKDIHSNHAFGKRLQRLLSMDKSPIKKT